MKVNRDKQTLKQILEDFASSTTAHGYMQVNLSTTRIQRWAWIAICTVVNFVGVLFLILLISKYFEYQTKDVISVRNHNLQFPSVTVCGLYPLAGSKQSKYAERWMKSMGTNKNLTNAYALEEFVGVIMPQKFMKENKTGQAERFLKNFNRIVSFMFMFENSPEEVAALSHSYEDLIVSCDFKGEPCKPEMFRYEFNSEYFKCYTFNGIGTNVSSEIMQTGPKYGLNIVFYIDISTLRPNLTIYNSKSPTGGNSGIRVTIHPPGTPPDIIEDGFNIVPGFSTDVGLTQNTEKKLRRPWGNCSDEEKLEGFGYKYSRASCRGLCRQQYLFANCRCITASYSVPPNLKHVKFCGKFDLQNMISDEVNISAITEDLDRLDCERRYLGHHIDTYPKGLECECPVPCHHNHYTKDLSYAKWPFKSATEAYYLSQLIHMENYENLSLYSVVEEARNNSDEAFHDIFESDFLRLNVFYNSLNEHIIEQVGDYELVDLAAELGGVYGICAGISVVTVCEVIQLLLSLYKWYQTLRKPKKINVIEADTNITTTTTTKE